MRTLIFSSLCFFMLACNTSTDEASTDLEDRRTKFTEPTLSFNSSKDSLHINLPDNNYLRVDLLLGIDSSRIVGGQPNKFTLSDIRSSTSIKVDTAMYLNGRVDGAFKCKDSAGYDHYYPFYHLYK